MIYLNDNLDAFDLDTALECMPEWRREVALRYTNQALQRQSAAAFALLQQALREEYGINEPINFVVMRNGKPALQGFPHIHFNLSHCRAAAICAVSRMPVGVDIETLRHPTPELVAYVMNPDEQKRIAGADEPDLEFIRLWTQKEAVVKYTGHGISSKSEIQTVLLAPHPPVVTVVDPMRRYVYSVCSPINECDGNNQVT